MKRASEDFSKALGQIIRSERESLAVSRDVIAARSGLHKNSIALIERGEQMPTVESFARIAHALEVSATGLLGKFLELGEGHVGEARRDADAGPDSRSLRLRRWRKRQVGFDHLLDAFRVAKKAKELLDKANFDQQLKALQAAMEARELLDVICDANGPYDKPWVVPDDVRKRLIDLSGFDDSE